MTNEEKVDAITRLINGHDPSMWLIPTDLLDGPGFIVYRRDSNTHYSFFTSAAAWCFYWTGVRADD